jgi:dolichyl-phosphate-mannose--protein O-mannosyl transferase
MTAAIAPIVIALISFFLRTFNLGSIKTLIFDEVYYVDGARDLLAQGVEVAGPNSEFVVHPPLGKWMIALGIQIFGDNPTGWRIATAFVGSLMILLIGLIAQRLFRNSLLTGLASALAALDGLALVHSRTALLDNFLAFFTLLATYFFIRRNYWLTGLTLGLALSTKWSALYFIAAFGLIALYRAFSHHTGKELIRPTIERFAQFGFLPILVYLTSWSGWFLNDRGWGRDYSDNVFASFFYYHQQILGFHTGLTKNHTYEASPWSWLLMGRPTSFFYESPTGCGSQSCSQEVLALGTPILWWLAIGALALVIGMWFRSMVTRHFDPAITIIIAGITAGYLPWFFFQERTVFTFYVIVFQPFLILALVYAARAIMARFTRSGEAIVAALFILIFLNFVYFLPIYLGDVITYEAWRSRMWFPSWI